MDLEDYPLLHFADLVLALLHAGQDRAGTMAEAAALLDRDRARAHELAAVDPAELAAHLDRARRHLVAAQLVDMLDQHSFRITPRGRAMLHQHPRGIDDSVLMGFPEFRDWMKRVSSHPPPEDARAREFQRGWAANQEGIGLGDNPYTNDTAQHAAWKDGWLEAYHMGRQQ
ncbi:MAG: hypothetical protein H7Z12_12220 [Rhodospirillaceae bacterium]|nr:hypothetical protein [Rhodospirillales bacterium]